jgi:putative methyltransferase (TIGR04325 family)
MASRADIGSLRRRARDLRPRWQVQRAVWALTPPVLLPLVRSVARRLGLASTPAPVAAPVPVAAVAAVARPPAVQPEPEPPHWEYVPEGFARQAKGWNVEAISDAYREKWPSYVAAIEGTKPLGVNHEVPCGQSVGFEDHGAHNMVVSYAYVLALAARMRDRISLLDWGGGVGHYLPLSRALVPDVEIDYHCRDVPVLAQHGRELFPEASFYDDDSCLQRRYDLVLVSASLQYAADWKATLAALAGATDGLLYVTRAPIALRSASFVVVQRAYDYGYDTEYLGWVFNRDELLAVAREAGGELVREFLLSAWLSAGGAPEAPVGHRGFLFAHRS